jgi:hypothetical protein
MRTLELAPASPFENIEATVASLKSRFPGITDEGINQAVKMQLDKGYKPRHKKRVVTFFGADIMSASIDEIGAWNLLPPAQQRRVLSHPIEGGLTIGPDDSPTKRIELANRLDASNVNRSVLISPNGLSQTYVWRNEGGTWHGLVGWFQEVTDADYDLIMKWPNNRRLLRDPEIHGLYQDVRSYNVPGEVVFEARNMKDVEYMIRQTANLNKPQWQGTDLPES